MAEQTFALSPAGTPRVQKLLGTANALFHHRTPYPNRQTRSARPVTLMEQP